MAFERIRFPMSFQILRGKRWQKDDWCFGNILNSVHFLLVTVKRAKLKRLFEHVHRNWWIHFSFQHEASKVWRLRPTSETQKQNPSECLRINGMFQSQCGDLVFRCFLSNSKRRFYLIVAKGDVVQLCKKYNVPLETTRSICSVPSFPVVVNDLVFSYWEEDEVTRVNDTRFFYDWLHKRDDSFKKEDTGF